MPLSMPQVSRGALLITSVSFSHIKQLGAGTGPFAETIVAGLTHSLLLLMFYWLREQEQTKKRSVLAPNSGAILHYSTWTVEHREASEMAIIGRIFS
jgi:hypothetical protein